VRLRWRSAAGVLGAAALVCSAGGIASSQPGGSGEPGAAGQGPGGAAGGISTPSRTAAPPITETTRPSSCPPVPSDQGGPDNEPRSATGTFPWPQPPPGTNPEDYAAYDRTPAQQPPLRPANWDSGGGDVKLTSARATDPSVSSNPQELCGVEGNSVDEAWQVSTGRPTTVIAVTDSGIEWCDPALVDKVYLNREALPLPENAQGLTKPQLESAGVHFSDPDPYDLDNSGVLNVAQYAADPRIRTPLFCQRTAGQDILSPEDLIIAFGHDGRVGPPGFTEAIAGWNFVDDNNDPYDDVHYGHGTGEAEDSTGAANTLAQEVGACPNCMVLPIRVGDSFVTQANAFAEGVDFAVDSGASVVQEALGTYDITDAARQAVRYALDHGVPVVASAADEEAEHHNLPALLPGTLVVNSVTQSPTLGGAPIFSPASYLYLNGCTNYGANIAVSVESSSCSSEATGKAAGIVGLAESAAADAVQEGRLSPYPGLSNLNGAPVALSADEVTQLVTLSADDVDFQTAAPPAPADNYSVSSPIPTSRYPTQPGFDIYTGYGRIDAARILSEIQEGRIPPEARIDQPGWFETYSPSQTLTVSGLVGAVRAKSYSWTLEVAAGAQPEPGSWHDVASGSGSGRDEGVLARLRLADVAQLFPPGTDSSSGPVSAGGEPNPDAFSFTLRLVVTDDRGLTGISRMTDYLHEDPSLLDGFPKQFSSSIDAGPTLAPIGPGHTNALLVATTDGTIHALLPDGREVPGWPVQTSPMAYHPGEHAYTSGQVTAVPRGTVLGGIAVGDLQGPRPRSRCRGPDHACSGLQAGRGRGASGVDVVAADLEGRVYAWDASGRLLPGFPVSTDRAYSSPAARDPDNRLLPGIFGAPALADLSGNGQLDVVAASMDRHVYAWQPDGKPVPGWPVLVVDPSEVSSVDPVTNKVTFKPSSDLEQGSKLMDTPAIGSLGGSGPPDVVVGSNEEYGGALDANYTNPIPLGSSTANSRVYAIDPRGSLAPARSSEASPPGFPNPSAFLPGWPVAVADLDSGLLPEVGDGTPGSPALADLSGNGQLEVGASTAIGPAYVLGPDGSSFLGSTGGLPNVLADGPAGPDANSRVTPTIPSLGSPVFAPLSGAGAAPSLIVPASSLGKVLDAALPAQQLPNDTQLDAWNPSNGQLQSAYPQRMDDNMFLAEPIVADVGGTAAGPYVVAGSATYDLRAIGADGEEAPGFPKFTGGWMVNAPSVGPFAGLPDQVLALGTREGYLWVWSTPTPAWAPSGPWPRDHHDLSNTSNLDAGPAPGSPRPCPPHPGR
jgi:hypothetical protein